MFVWAIDLNIFIDLGICMWVIKLMIVKSMIFIEFPFTYKHVFVSWNDNFNLILTIYKIDKLIPKLLSLDEYTYK